MTFGLKFEMLLFSIFIILIILYILKKDKISTKYSIVWLGSGLILFLFSVFPNFLVWLSKLLGFQVPSNMFFSLLFLLLILISLSLTIIVSGQSNKIRVLIQEVAILRKEKDEKNKK